MHLFKSRASGRQSVPKLPNAAASRRSTLYIINWKRNTSDNFHENKCEQALMYLTAAISIHDVENSNLKPFGVSE